MVLMVRFRSLQETQWPERETVGMTLRMTTTFSKFQRALWPKEVGWGKKIFGYIYTKIAHNFFCIIYHRSRAYLKPSVNFGNFFNKSPLRIPAYRAFHLNSELNFEILFNWLIMSSSRCVLHGGMSRCVFACVSVGWGWLLLEYCRTPIKHYKVLFSILAFFIFKSNCSNNLPNWYT